MVKLNHAKQGKLKLLHTYLSVKTWGKVSDYQNSILLLHGLWLTSVSFSF